MRCRPPPSDGFVLHHQRKLALAFGDVLRIRLWRDGGRRKTGMKEDRMSNVNNGGFLS